MSRHPEIAARKGKKVNGARASKFNRIAVAKWYETVRPIFAQYKPEETFNVDDKHVNSEELVPRQVSALSLHRLHSLTTLLSPPPISLHLIGSRSGAVAVTILPSRSRARLPTMR